MKINKLISIITLIIALATYSAFSQAADIKFKIHNHTNKWLKVNEVQTLKPGEDGEHTSNRNDGWGGNLWLELIRYDGMDLFHCSVSVDYNKVPPSITRLEQGQDGGDEHFSCYQLGQYEITIVPASKL